jgi:hypothetical protein
MYNGWDSDPGILGNIYSMNLQCELQCSRHDFTVLVRYLLLIGGCMQERVCMYNIDIDSTVHAYTI